MKKWMIVGMIVGTMAFSFAGCGGNMSSSAAVPNKVLDEFYDSYPTAEDVKWKNKDGLFEADFEIGNKDLKATYTSDGDLVRIDS